MGDLRLLVVTAHPDDEALGFGGLLAKCAAEGVETHLAVATLGERGRIGTERPGPEVVAPVRDGELRRAAAILGVAGLDLLGFHDGDLERVDPAVAVERLVAVLRRVRPQVVVTFGADGAYGHPDHIAVSQWTGAALVAAADAAYPEAAAQPPHRVDKLYWMAMTRADWETYTAAFGELVSRAGGVERRATPWPDWAVTTELDTRAHWRTVWDAVQCHQSQITGYGALAAFPLDRHVELWGGHSLYRVFSSVDVGQGRERELFAGLRGGG